MFCNLMLFFFQRALKFLLCISHIYFDLLVHIITSLFVYFDRVGGEKVDQRDLYVATGNRIT